MRIDTPSETRPAHGRRAAVLVVEELRVLRREQLPVAEHSRHHAVCIELVADRYRAECDGDERANAGKLPRAPDDAQSSAKPSPMSMRRAEECAFEAQERQPDMRREKHAGDGANVLAAYTELCSLRRGRVEQE